MDSITWLKMNNLKLLIFEVIYNAVKDNVLFQMVLNRKIYKDKIDDMFPVLIINWCLVHYCTLTGQIDSKKHWCDKLYYDVRIVVTSSLNKNDSVKFKILSEIWEERDLDDSWRIDLMIDLEFEKENISTDTDEYSQVINDFIQEKDKLFNILLCRDKTEIENYIYNNI